MTATAARSGETPAPAAPRRYPLGAELLPDGSVHFRLWAPGRRRVAAVIGDGGREVPLEPEGSGYFSVLVAGLPAGSLYRFRLDDDATLYPDPASRFQPDGPHGPSQVVDPFRFDWTDRGWTGLPLRGQVIYEMHVGTFTPEGTWEAAIAQLPHLAGLGVTVLELMPVAEFPGRFGWGYDGVDLFAPTRLYGTPDGMRCDVDGNLWCGWGMGSPDLDGVMVFAPDGKPIGRIALPDRCANLCFGGAKRNRLFMASSHSLYALYVETRGAA